jgi:hypothetical protein
MFTSGEFDTGRAGIGDPRSPPFTLLLRGVLAWLGDDVVDDDVG